MPLARLSVGAIAGIIATVPMTLFMVVVHRLLPRREQQPLPPEQITADLVQRSRLRRFLTWNGERTLAWALHFAFGASAGMLYAGLLARVPLPAWLKGTAFGIVVWVGSYFGWLPSQQIHGQGDEQTWRRNALMLAAHLVWGTTLGMLVMQRMPGGENAPQCFAGRPRDIAHAS